MVSAGEKRVKRETGESPVLSRNCEMAVFSIMPLAVILPGRRKKQTGSLQHVKAYEIAYEI